MSVKRGAALFDAVKEFVADEATRDPVAGGVILNTSWAVWADPGPSGFTRASDVSFPGEEVAREHAHARVILLAMNPGNDSARGDWSNFHHSWRSRDQLLSEACRGTGLWGALMTDLYFDQHESESSSVDTGPEKSKEGVRRLLDLIDLSGEEAPLIICLGGKAFGGVKKGLKAFASEDGRAPTLNYLETTHYSGSAAKKHKHQPTTYRDLVHQSIRVKKFEAVLEPEGPR